MEGKVHCELEGMIICITVDVMASMDEAIAENAKLFLV